MRTIKNFHDANAALLPYVPLVAQLTGKDTTLERIRPLMKLLGDPQNRIKVIHIAGTSGKTSTAYFSAALLRATGKYVGLTVSPHVDSVAERVQLNGQPLSERQFCDELAEFLEVVDRAVEKPSYFELLYAFSLWVFDREHVDYAVVETGMGGLFDATNVIDRADKLCIITDIGYDHMHVLGNTLEQIAAQKAGIIQLHNPVIMYEQSNAITDVFRRWSADHKAALMLMHEASERAAYGLPFVKGMPEYQRRNWLLAYRAYRFLAERDDLPVLTVEQLHSTQTIQVPARMESRRVGNKMVVMDGAHNEQKMATFLASFQHAYPSIKPAVLIALKKDKDIRNLGSLFSDIASRIIVTTFNTSQDLPAQSANPMEVVDAFKAAGIANISAIPEQHEALMALLAGDEEVCIITGSFYLLSQLRAGKDLK